MGSDGFPLPPEQFTALQEATAEQHELWRAWVRAGFTPEQALYLLAGTIGAKLLPPSGFEQTG